MSSWNCKIQKPVNYKLIHDTVWWIFYETGPSVRKMCNLHYFMYIMYALWLTKSIAVKHTSELPGSRKTINCYNKHNPKYTPKYTPLQLAAHLL